MGKGSKKERESHQPNSTLAPTAVSTSTLAPASTQQIVPKSSGKAATQVRHIISDWLNNGEAPSVKMLQTLFAMSGGVGNLNISVDVNHKNVGRVKGITLFTCALYVAHESDLSLESFASIINYLLEQNVFINNKFTVDADYESTHTALSLVTEIGDVSFAQKLLQAGALLTEKVARRFPRTKIIEEMDYLTLAVKCGKLSEEMISFLISARDINKSFLDVGVGRANGHSVLAVAAARRLSPELILRLIPPGFPTERERITVCSIISQYYGGNPEILQRCGIEPSSPSKDLYNAVSILRPEHYLLPSAEIRKLMELIKANKEKIDSTEVYNNVNALFVLFIQLIEMRKDPEKAKGINFLLQVLLQVAKDINRPLESAKAPLLIYAVMFSLSEVVPMLLRQPGIDVDQKDNEGLNALAYAIGACNDGLEKTGVEPEDALAMFKALIAHNGTDVYSPCDSTTPVWAIMSAKNYPLLELFINYPLVDPNKLYVKCLTQVDENQEAASTAASSASPAVVDVHPFVVAVQSGDVESVRIFLAHKGFKPENIACGYGYFLTLALLHIRTDIFKLLLDHCNDPRITVGPNKNYNLWDFVSLLKYGQRFKRILCEKFPDVYSEASKLPVEGQSRDCSSSGFFSESGSVYQVLFDSRGYAYELIESSWNYLRLKGYNPLEMSKKREENSEKPSMAELIVANHKREKDNEVSSQCTWLGGILSLQSRDLAIHELERGSFLYFLADYRHIKDNLPVGGLERLQKMRMHICAPEGQNGIVKLQSFQAESSLIGFPGTYPVTHEIKFGYGNCRVFCVTLPSEGSGGSLLVPVFVGSAFHDSASVEKVQSLAKRPVDLSWLLPSGEEKTIGCS